MARSHLNIRVLAWPCLLLAIVGCAARNSPPFAAPEVTIRADHYLGSPLTGPVVKALPVDKPEDALAVSVAMVALDRIPPQPAPSVASQARLIAVTRGGVPVQAGARLTQAARIIDGEDKDRFLTAGIPADKTKPPLFRTADVGGLSGALPPGVTLRLDIAEPDAAPRYFQGQSFRRHIAIELYRPKADTALQLALIVEDLLAQPLGLDTTQAKTNDVKANPKPSRSSKKPVAPKPLLPQAPVRELLLVDRPSFAASDRFALIVPYRFGDSESQAIAIFLEVAAGSDDPQHKAAFSHCLDDLAHSISSARAATQPYREQADSPEWPALQSALDALSRPGAPRSAMLFLASQTNVAIFGDIALSADDSVRGELAKKVFAKIGVPLKAHSKESLAWMLESASYELLSEQRANGKLPPELAAILAIHAGEAGRHPGSLDDGLKTSTNRGDFALRLIAENYIYLEDSSPASRVRAYDWLIACDRGPAGYDPLGAPKARRAALERAMNPDTGKPQAAGDGR